MAQDDVKRKGKSMIDSQIPVLTRRQMLALGVVTAGVSVGNVQRGLSAPGTATPLSVSDGLVHRGINYDVGTAVTPEFTTRPDAHRAFLQPELEAIRDDLHCNSVAIFGGSAERLIEGATVAMESGLNVRLQPRLIDMPVEETLVQLAEISQATAGIAGGDSEVVFDIGCELTLMSHGIVPGESFAERLEYFLGHLDELPSFNESMNALLAQATTEVRKSFDGRITYASGSWEAVDWSGFDIVGVDLYRDGQNAAGYLDVLRSYTHIGKPVWITEFGCCSYEGADDLGGSGFDVIDWSANPPQLVDAFTRSESVQATYISDLLDLYMEEGIDGAFVYQFMEPHLPHDPDPLKDLDMASYGIVKTLPANSDHPYDSTGYWEPKEAFAAIAERIWWSDGPTWRDADHLGMNQGGGR
jgi:hypothetical protein